jgi:hypothetical protein
MMGITFALPAMMSRCACNAVNALQMRHLSAPKNAFRAPTLVNFFLLSPVREHLLRSYPLKLAQQLEGQWRAKKSQARLRQIDKSIAFDPTYDERAKSFIKSEVHCKVPKKARGIQGNVTDSTAYQHPEEYAALSKTMGDPIVFELNGVAFEFQYTAGLNHDDLSDSVNNAIMASPVHCFHERDGRNWDSNVNFDLLMLKLAVYRMLRMDAVAQVERRMRGVKGTVRVSDDTLRAAKVIKYFIFGKVLSGDWDTSVGNSIISMLVAAYAISNLPIGLRPKRAWGWFMGDDYLGLYDYDVMPDCKALRVALDGLEAETGIDPISGIFLEPEFVLTGCNKSATDTTTGTDTNAPAASTNK